MSASTVDTAALPAVHARAQAQARPPARARRGGGTVKRLLPLLCLCACMAASARERYALLVGVAALPALPAATWLGGPPRDVAAMRAALLQQGFSDERIISLGSGADDVQLPTRAAILGRLGHLARTLAAGDVLVLYWSGQALLLPGLPGKQTSPLGEGVQLLTRDSRIGANGRELMGGISSAELGHAIDAIGARHAQTVAVFDTGNAAGGARSDGDALAWRGLEPADIGWQPDAGGAPGGIKRAASTAATTVGAAATAVKTAAVGAAATAVKSATAGAIAVKSATARAAGAVARGAATSAAGAVAGIETRANFIGFYASEAQQRTAEARTDGASAVAAGLFTRAVIAALHGTPENYQAWARATAQQYRAALSEQHLPAASWPSPVFAGALDVPLWQAAAGGKAR